MASTATARKPSSPTIVNLADSALTSSTPAPVVSVAPKEKKPRAPKGPTIWSDSDNPTIKKVTQARDYAIGAAIMAGAVTARDLVDALRTDPAYEGVGHALTPVKVAARVKRIRDLCEARAASWAAKSQEPGDKADTVARKNAKTAKRMVLGRARSTPDVEGLLALFADDRDDDEEGEES